MEEATREVAADEVLDVSVPPILIPVVQATLAILLTQEKITMENRNQILGIAATQSDSDNSKVFTIYCLTIENQ